MKALKVTSTFIILCSVLLFVFAIPTMASSSKPYSNYYTSLSVVEGRADIATASITRCSCLPVNNYMEAYMRYQYKVGNNYFWEPEESASGTPIYYYRDGTNVEALTHTASEHYIYVVEGIFRARCGTNGTLHRYTDTTYR